MTYLSKDSNGRSNVNAEGKDKNQSLPNMETDDDPNEIKDAKESQMTQRDHMKVKEWVREPQLVCFKLVRIQIKKTAFEGLFLSEEISLEEDLWINAKPATPT